MSGTTIRSVQVQDLNIAMRESFGIAGGAQDIAQNVLLTIELENGIRGYGEAAPLRPFNGETQDSARAALENAKPRLIGRDVSEWQAIAEELPSFLHHAGTARCAIETAVLDAMCRAENRPLWAFFGPTNGPLETDMTVTIQGHLSPKDAESHAAKSAAAIAARGMKIIKTKVGGNVAIDLSRVRAIHAAAPNCGLLLDGNCGYNADQALELLTGLQQHGIEIVLFEQPVPKDDHAGLKRISSEGKVAVAADESAADINAVETLIANQVVDVVNIKLSKCGILEGMKIAAACKSAGIGLMIGGMVESRLAMGTSACFAAGTGGFTFIDLDTPLFMAEDPFNGGYRQEGPQIFLDEITAGHGISPKT